jgi:hypothetical protein
VYKDRSLTNAPRSDYLTGTIDFGALSFEPTAAQWEQMPGVQLVPVLGQAVIPSYNVRLASLHKIA